MAVLSFTGPCVVHGECVCSSNYQNGTCDAGTNASGGYAREEACEVTFRHPVTLNVHVFDVHDGYFYYTYVNDEPEQGCMYDNLTVNEV